jgi:hypothetical protein
MGVAVSVRVVNTVFQFFEFLLCRNTESLFLINYKQTQIPEPDVIAY